MSMRYFLAIVFPPLAVLLCGRPIQALLNLFLLLFLWVPAVVHALLVVHDHLSEKRLRHFLREVREQQQARLANPA
jgi:uncharacterized membrane protein YqaE (UPF0057 family)